VNLNEQKFYDALSDLFVGAKVEGKGGYVNLMKIKSNYYKKVLEQFKKKVDSDPVLQSSFREEFFDKLYDFFHRYFSETGSVFFVKTTPYQRIYERVYSPNKDVVLFWKTHMLYYIKSDILFKSIEVEVEDEKLGTFYFFFDVGELEQKQNNEKRELVFKFKEIKTEGDSENNKKVIVLTVEYSQRGTKTKKDEILKNIRKQGIKITEEILDKALRVFKKQSEVDYFINKDAKKFLEEQLELYLHQLLLKEENKFGQKRLDQIKAIKIYAKKIIAFISQFEDELVKIWNKPKFALNANYVITLDRLTPEIIQKLAKHPGMKEQIKEWQELNIVNEDFKFEDIFENGLLGTDIKEEYKHLPIDTKYFKDLELEILNLFEDLDEALDGRLIKSENYQALVTLLPKYKEKVQTIYIDPPFNTGKDFAYVDRFQDSTWLTLMYDRIKLGREFLKDTGSFWLHLDYNANYLGRELLNNIFNKNNFINEIIWSYEWASTVKDRFANKHDTIFWYSKLDKWIFNLDEVRVPYTLEQLKGYKKDEKGYYTQDSTGKKWYAHSKGQLPKDVFEIGIISRSAYERLDFYTQKPEKLLARIIKAASNEKDLILDFFAGSATTQAVAHKLGRKWLGVEMGEHFYTVDIPRMKKVLAGYLSGISRDLKKEGELNVGGFFKYYELEQFEDTLRKMRYKDYEMDTLFTEPTKIFEHYILVGDQKLALSEVIQEKEGERLDIDFDKLYKNIDWPETLSNLLGLPIKKIKKGAVVLKDGDKEKEVRFAFKNMSKEEKIEFLKLIKPLIWWGE